MTRVTRKEEKTDLPPAEARLLTLFLCGDVMTGRGIDQILPHPSAPRLHEDYMKNALGYVNLAEQASGPIKRPADYSYIWGDALAELERVSPDLRIINLETAVTRSEEWEDKGINYRMHPENIPCITAAKIDCCCLANNHVLDWGYDGLMETISTLRTSGVHCAGAGRGLKETEAPAVLEAGEKARVLVFSFGTGSSGIPAHWAPSENRPGVNLLPDFSEETAHRIGEKVREIKQAGDIALASIHWGRNWGYEVSQSERAFAHRLIDEAGIDVIHGHSSHHVKGIEVYRERLILYGCGDFLNDYEGIGGFESFRADLGLMYFVAVDTAGRLRSLRMRPTKIKLLRVNYASEADGLWLRDLLNREGGRFGTATGQEEDGTLDLLWRNEP